MSDDARCRPACPIDWMFGPLDDATLARMREEFRVTACRNGHPYDAENTYRNPAGHRVCRACRRDQDRIRKGEAASTTPGFIQGLAARSFDTVDTTPPAYGRLTAARFSTGRHSTAKVQRRISGFEPFTPPKTSDGNPEDSVVKEQAGNWVHRSEPELCLRLPELYPMRRTCECQSIPPPAKAGGLLELFQ